VHDTKIREAFTTQRHALLFAWVALEAVVRAGGEMAAPVMRAAIRRHGEQRGHRMALRAQQDGQPLSIASYLSYREREVPASVSVSQAAPETFAARFGASTADVLAGDAGTDFDVLPEGR
jgi:hypothetical protein